MYQAKWTRSFHRSQLVNNRNWWVHCLLHTANKRTPRWTDVGFLPSEVYLYNVGAQVISWVISLTNYYYINPGDIEVMFTNLAIVNRGPTLYTHYILYIITTRLMRLLSIVMPFSVYTVIIHDTIHILPSSWYIIIVNHFHFHYCYQ